MSAGAYVVWVGIALSLVGWIWFRLPGQAFWFKAPVWRASRHLTPTGAKLWVAGSVVSFVGIAWMAAERFL